jgi:hypothetical protein
MTTGGLEAKEGGGLLVISAANTAGNLTNGVTLNGDVVVSGDNSALRVSGGLTLNGLRVLAAVRMRRLS